MPTSCTGSLSLRLVIPHRAKMAFLSSISYKCSWMKDSIAAFERIYRQSGVKQSHDFIRQNILLFKSNPWDYRSGEPGPTSCCYLYSKRVQLLAIRHQIDRLLGNMG